MSFGVICIFWKHLAWLNISHSRIQFLTWASSSRDKSLLTISWMLTANPVCVLKKPCNDSSETLSNSPAIRNVDGNYGWYRQNISGLKNPPDLWSKNCFAITRVKIETLIPNGQPNFSRNESELGWVWIFFERGRYGLLFYTTKIIKISHVIYCESKRNFYRLVAKRKKCVVSLPQISLDLLPTSLIDLQVIIKLFLWCWIKIIVLKWTFEGITRVFFSLPAGGFFWYENQL